MKPNEPTTKVNSLQGSGIFSPEIKANPDSPCEKIMYYIRRMFSGDHFLAANRWIANLGDCYDSNYIELLMKEWYLRVRQHQGQDSPQFLFAFFTYLAGLSVKQHPDSHTIRFLLETIEKFPHLETWNQLIDIHLGCRSAEDIVPAWVTIYEKLCETAKRSSEACVTFDEIHESLQKLLFYFTRHSSKLELKKNNDDIDAFTAATNGRHIKLPAKIKLAPHREVNTWGYAYLLAHEAEHIVSGTFNFSYASPRGKEVWQRLKKRREIFNLNRKRWDRDEVAAKLIRNGVEIPLDFKPALTHLSAFFMHFRNPEALQGLFNLVEDVRIEHILTNKYPGLAKIIELINAYQAALEPNPLFKSIEYNFFNAMLQRAHGRALSAHVAGKFHKAWKLVAHILDKHRTAPICGVDSSVLTTLHLYETLLKYFPKDHRGELDAILQVQSTIAVEEVVYGLMHAGSKVDSRQIKRSDYHDLPEKEPDDHGPWHIYPEFNRWTSSREDNAAYVQEIRWQPRRPPNKSIQHKSIAANTNINTCRGPLRRKNKQYFTEGLEIDPERAHDFITSHHAGKKVEGRIFYSRSGDDCAVTLTLLIDLSASMETPRAHQNGEVPMHRAISLANHLSENMALKEIQTGIFGLHDFGRRRIQLYNLKDYEEPYCRLRLESLHAMYIGGFRYGAGLRHLGTRLANKYHGSKNVIVVLFDTGTHYLSTGLEHSMGEFFTERCMACSHRCNTEPIDEAALDASEDVGKAYFPLSYELADIHDAICSLPHIKPFLVLLDSGYPDEVLNEVVGVDRWMRLLSIDDAASAGYKIETLLC